jgi:DNA (cytosine-5)-methyltransferase 1
MADKKTRRSRQLTVAELFAGVGGFRLGLEGTKRGKNSSFRTVWANQWEPGKIRQNAADVYRLRFGDFPHLNEDIQKVIQDHFDGIPDHDVLCGGFPCQDYSVARTLSQATGIHGKKGVLWWSIHDIVSRKLQREKKGKGKAPRYLILENVDRLLKSPAGQRGRDFAVMLASLANLGYAVEWRVINSGEYGFPQRRKRIFIVAYHPKTATYRRIAKASNRLSWIEKDGVLARAFPVRLRDRRDDKRWFRLPDGEEAATQENLIKITRTFNKMPEGRDSPFSEAGVMFEYDVWTSRVHPEYEGTREVLGDVILDRDEVAKEFFIDEIDRKKWEFLKGAKSIERISQKTGAKYSYDEGGIAFPDYLDRPSRTIITGEGGRTPSRFKHVIREGKRLRRLTPIELERLNGFPDDHTKLEGVSDATRAFFMGNALVVGVVKRIGDELIREIRRKG